MPTTWLTADTHFNHLNIIAYTKRPFFKSGYGPEDLEALLNNTPNGRRPDRQSLNEIVDVRAHDEAIVQNWNDRVSSGDTVYHLGDFAFGIFEHYLRRLNGNKILIMGNHDKGIERYERFFGHIFREPPLNRGISINGEKVILNHYPMLSWNAAFHGRLHFFGHVHSAPHRIFICSRNSYDVGVDNNNFSPISFEEASERAKNNPNVLRFGENGVSETLQNDEDSIYDQIEIE